MNRKELIRYNKLLKELYEKEREKNKLLKDYISESKSETCGTMKIKFPVKRKKSKEYERGKEALRGLARR